MKTKEFQIQLSEAMKIFHLSGIEGNEGKFEIEYRRADGSFGTKKNVIRRAGKINPESSILNKEKTDFENRRAGKLRLIDSEGQAFDIWICLWRSINGKLINHKY